MHYVVLRDDDTNALTPPAALERLYRPFLDRGMPVNLAVIPDVRADVRLPDGRREGFLPPGPARGGDTVPLAAAPGLVAYLRANPGYQVVQHGCHHDRFEFDQVDRREAARRLDRGRRRLQEAGWGPTPAFVAPHDRFSRAAYLEAAQRFPVVSSGWFEWRRVPWRWGPAYLGRKLRGEPHWQAGGSLLLSHPGCLLSRHRPATEIPAAVAAAVVRQRVTVLVTHWWEYFGPSGPEEPFIGALHETAEWLASRSDVAVVPFADLPARLGVA